METIWWEKTVEYRFIVQLLGSGYWIAPLDGVHEERAGDAILQADRSYLLVEFKRDEKALASEPSKFGSSYGEAQKDLGARDRHHLLIFGRRNGTRLALEHLTYFSRLETSLEEALDSGLTRDDFEQYLRDYSWYRPRRRSGGSGGGARFGGGIDYSLVLSVGSDERLGVMSLGECMDGLRLTVDAPKPGGPAGSPRAPSRSGPSL